MKKAIAAILALCACSSGTAPVAGDGIKVDSGAKLSVDPARVPVVPSCPAGLVVRRTADGSGWECKAVALGEVAGITTTTQWPGSTDWSRISNAPAVVTSGSTVAVTGPGGAPVPVTGLVSIAGTPPVSISGNSTVVGTGTAGVPAGGVLTVQGQVGATPVPVNVGIPGIPFNYFGWAGSKLYRVAPSSTNAFYMSSITVSLFATTGSTYPSWLDFGYAAAGTTCLATTWVFRCNTPTSGTCGSPFPTPLRIPANNDLCVFQYADSGYVTVIGYLAP
jgi:hypothetical protein